jgi:hypothetical protein
VSRDTNRACWTFLRGGFIEFYGLSVSRGLVGCPPSKTAPDKCRIVGVDSRRAPKSSRARTGHTLRAKPCSATQDPRGPPIPKRSPLHPRSQPSPKKGARRGASCPPSWVLVAKQGLLPPRKTPHLSHRNWLCGLPPRNRGRDSGRGRGRGLDSMSRATGPHCRP